MSTGKGLAGCHSTVGDTFCQKYRGPQFNPSSALLRAILEIGSNTSHEPLANPVRSQMARLPHGMAARCGDDNDVIACKNATALR